MVPPATKTSSTTTNTLGKRRASPTQASSSQARAKRRQISHPITRASRRSSSRGRLEDEPIAIAASPKKPITIRKPTSIASCNLRQVRLTRSVTLNSERESNGVANHVTKFAPSSTVNPTWGEATAEPVIALERKRRHCGLAVVDFRKGRQSAFGKLMNGDQLDAEPATDNASITNTFPFLQLPLEIRREIYKYVLIQPGPIRLRPDWLTVYESSGNALHNHTILRVCKQILQESTSILYEKNIFSALIHHEDIVGGRPSLSVRNSQICPKFLHHFRDVVVDCKIEKWCPSVFKATATCIASLALTSGILDSLTLTITPSSPDIWDAWYMLDGSKIPGNKAVNAIKTSSVFARDSGIMSAIVKLRCKILKIVVRLPEFEPVELTVNMRPLWAYQPECSEDMEQDWFMNDIVARRQRREMRAQAMKDLEDLQMLLDEVRDYWTVMAFIIVGRKGVTKKLRSLLAPATSTRQGLLDELEALKNCLVDIQRLAKVVESKLRKPGWLFRIAKRVKYGGRYNA